MIDNMEKLHHLEMPPKIMPLQFLEEITDNFSKERKLGSGTFGNVYKVHISILTPTYSLCYKHRC